MRRLRNSGCLVAIAVAVVAAAFAPAAAPAAERWTPVGADVVSPPQPVPGGDGRVHLAYELLLINRSFNPPAAITLRSVQARAGKPASARRDRRPAGPSEGTASRRALG